MQHRLRTNAAVGEPAADVRQEARFRADRETPVARCFQPQNSARVDVQHGELPDVPRKRQSVKRRREDRPPWNTVLHHGDRLLRSERIRRDLPKRRHIR